MAKQRKHISIRMISALMFGATAIMLAIGLISSRKYSDKYNSTQQAYEASVLCRQSARDIQIASDLLTRTACSFAMSYDTDDAKDYLSELTASKRRDTAYDIILKNAKEEKEIALIKTAMENSDYLVGLELYSMRLVCESCGFDPASLSNRLVETKLTAADSALSADEQKQRAAEILFSEDYRTHRRAFDNALFEALVEIREQVSKNLTATNAAFDELYRNQVFISICFAVLMLVMIIWVHRLVISPLHKFVASINRHEKITPRGAAEMITLAAMYNQIFDENASRHKELNDQASTDALTGVNNRLVFERCCLQRMLGTQKALMLVDIDYFKHVNDQYGHDTGDRILQKVARVLTENVRGEDMVCRIGGDEFVVIMQRIRPDRSIQIEAKIDRIAAMLRNTDDGLPAVTLSIGIAFGDGDCPIGHLHKNADLALYEVKENGRNGYRFYANGAASNGSEDENIPVYDDEKSDAAEKEESAEYQEAEV